MMFIWTYFEESNVGPTRVSIKVAPGGNEWFLEHGLPRIGERVCLSDEVGTEWRVIDILRDPFCPRISITVEKVS